MEARDFSHERFTIDQGLNVYCSMEFRENMAPKEEFGWEVVCRFKRGRFLTKEDFHAFCNVFNDQNFRYPAYEEDVSFPIGKCKDNAFEITEKSDWLYIANSSQQAVRISLPDDEKIRVIPPDRLAVIHSLKLDGFYRMD